MDPAAAAAGKDPAAAAMDPAVATGVIAIVAVAGKTRDADDGAVHRVSLLVPAAASQAAFVRAWRVSTSASQSAGASSTTKGPRAGTCQGADAAGGVSRSSPSRPAGLAATGPDVTRQERVGGARDDGGTPEKPGNARALRGAVVTSQVGAASLGFVEGMGRLSWLTSTRVTSQVRFLSPRKHRRNHQDPW